MGADIKRENECFQQDYDKLYAKGTWTPEEVKTMKDLKKLIYYNLAIQAMEKGSGYSDEEYSPEMSYARGRSNRSGMHPYFPDGGSGMYYDGGGNGRSGNYYDGGNGNGRSGTGYYDGGSDRSGRRYYDGEKEKAMKQLHRMMENSDDPERRNALRMAIQELEMK